MDQCENGLLSPLTEALKLTLPSPGVAVTLTVPATAGVTVTVLDRGG